MADGEDTRSWLLILTLVALLVRLVGMDDVFVELTNEFADVLTVSEAVELPDIDDDPSCIPAAAPATAATGNANTSSGRQ